MLKAEHLTLTRSGVTVIKDVSLSLASGKVIGILGANGAGKSTLLAGLCGDMAATQGQVLLQSQLLGQWRAAERAQYLAVLLQDSALNFSFTVSEVVALGRLPHQTTQPYNLDVINEVLALMDIKHLVDRNYLTLSGGEKQRVHMARILAQIWPLNEYRVLLLDEPTSMLDPLHQHTVLKVVCHCAARGASVMLIIHDLNLAARYCDELVMLHEGAIFTQGAPWDVLTSAHLKTVFGLDTIITAHPERGYPLVIPQ